jgi:hypothetical protein
MPKSLEQQAEDVLKKYLALGTKKQNTNKIHGTQYKEFTSIRSYNETTKTLARIAKSMGVTRLRKITSEDAHRYLYDRKNQKRKGDNVLHAELQPKIVGQKTLDAERKSLSILLNENINRVHSPNSSLNSSRSYRNEQIDEITKHQTKNYALATKIALDSGLRAKELITIQRYDELKITHSNKWHKERFSGVTGERYVTVGKGGLIREIRISKDLAIELEKLRREVPLTVKDRGNIYQSYYDIPGGNKFSKSFSTASQRTLGYSNGAHGLRHQYAQGRLAELKSKGYNQKEAKKIISQEIGHFRASIINVYLR